MNNLYLDQKHIAQCILCRRTTIKMLKQPKQEKKKKKAENKAKLMSHSKKKILQILITCWSLVIAFECDRKICYIFVSFVNQVHGNQRKFKLKTALNN